MSHTHLACTCGGIGVSVGQRGGGHEGGAGGGEVQL